MLGPTELQFYELRRATMAYDSYVVGNFYDCNNGTATRVVS